jgi:hypothetical protein
VSVKERARATRTTIRHRPAETTAAGLYPAVTGFLTAFGVDPVKAAAVAGLIASLAPMVVTYFVARRKG